MTENTLKVNKLKSITRPCLHRKTSSFAFYSRDDVYLPVVRPLPIPTSATDLNSNPKTNPKRAINGSWLYILIPGIVYCVYDVNTWHFLCVWLAQLYAFPWDSLANNLLATSLAACNTTTHPNKKSGLFTHDRNPLALLQYPRPRRGTLNGDDINTIVISFIFIILSRRKSTSIPDLSLLKTDPTPW